MAGKLDTTLAAIFVMAFTVWIAVSVLGGGGEAWDKSAYWKIGLPLLYLSAVALAWIGSAAPWKLWLWAGLGQFAGLLATASSWSLWPLGLIMLALLSLPVAVVALACRALRRRLSP